MLSLTNTTSRNRCRCWRLQPVQLFQPDHHTEDENQHRLFDALHPLMEIITLPFFFFVVFFFWTGLTAWRVARAEEYVQKELSASSFTRRNYHEPGRKTAENMVMISSLPAVAIRSLLHTDISYTFITPGETHSIISSSDSFYISPIICLPSTLLTDAVHKVLIVPLDGNQTRGICARWLVTLRSCAETSHIHIHTHGSSFLFSYKKQRQGCREIHPPCVPL